MFESFLCCRQILVPFIQVKVFFVHSQVSVCCVPKHNHLQDVWILSLFFSTAPCADSHPLLVCFQQSNMKSLEHELHCPVCKEIVKQPVVLPCLHSVCLLCASEVLVANGYPPPELPPEPNSPASTPNTRSPRQARRPTPKNEQRPIDRVLRSGL